MAVIEQDLWGNETFHEEARATDPVTSHVAAKMPFKRDSQRHLLLRCYEYARGLTDAEAAEAAGINRGCPWKRCSELREMGLIQPITGVTRMSPNGAMQRVCAITAQGLAVLDKLS
jgi:hypothetical protein